MKVGVSKVTVSRWENGEVFPQPLYCRKLCEALGTDLEELFPEASKRSQAHKVYTEASDMSIQVNGLRQARLQRHLSQEELARTLNTTRGSVTRWERGLGSPNLPHLRQLCQLLSASPGDLFPDAITEPSLPTQEEAKETEPHVPTFRSSGQRLFDY